jgi:hypothetical protein
LISDGIPETVFGARVKFPSASIRNGPVVGVTSVFADVTAIPFKSAPLPLLNTLPTVVTTVVLGTCGWEASSNALI